VFPPPEQQRALAAGDERGRKNGEGLGRDTSRAQQAKKKNKVQPGKRTVNQKLPGKSPGKQCGGPITEESETASD